MVVTDKENYFTNQCIHWFVDTKSTVSETGSHVGIGMCNILLNNLIIISCLELDGLSKYIH